MRVCTASGTDAEGNKCNWTGCGLGSGTGNFGGCYGNTSAGTLCVPASGCADGSVEQLFAEGVVGCAGQVPFAQADDLCAPGYSTVAADRWEGARGKTVPTHDYWVRDDYAKPGDSTGLNRYEGTATSCTACSGATCVHGSNCPSDAPMHVCTASGTDPEGNTCEWAGCNGVDGAPAYFGGCYGLHDSTAGALCAPREGCAYGAPFQHFDPSVQGNGTVTAYGCSGSVLWSHPGSIDAASLCAPGYLLARADDWAAVAKQGNQPTHEYWTGDNLRWSGSASGTCSATTSGGNSCPSGPMHVCSPSGTDADGNGCEWANCGLNATSPNLYFGGCSSVPDRTAGALCVSYASYCPPGMASTGSTTCTSSNCYGGCRFLDGYYTLSQVTGAPSGDGIDSQMCQDASEAPVPSDLAGYGCSRGLTYGEGSVWACRADLYRPSASYDAILHTPKSDCVGGANPGYVLVRTHCQFATTSLDLGGSDSCPVDDPNMGCHGPCLL
jgi:hypothetical protein